MLQLVGVTVYPNGASYRYGGLLSAEKGYTYWVWTGLPPQADPKSVRVLLPSSARGYIVQTAVEPLGPDWFPEPPDVQALRRNIDSLEATLARLQQRLTVLQAQEATLLSNQKLGGEEGPTRPEEVEKYLNLLERRLSAVLSEKAPLQKKVTALQDTLNRWKKRYEGRLQGFSQGRAVLLVTYWSPQKEVLPLTVELSGAGASWQLRYRVRALPAVQRVLFQRWAEVSNLSGEDWKNLSLTLSSARPSQAGAMPPFMPWYVDVALSLLPGGRYKAARLQAEAAESPDGATEDSDNEPQEAETLSSPLPAVAEQTLSRTYELGPQTILAGRRATQFFLREDTLGASFQFFWNAPVENRAYLRAALPLGSFALWEAGPATLEVEGQEVARLSWPPAYEGDTVWLDLGPTQRIQLRRTETLNRKDNRLTGSSVHHQFAYSLQVSHAYPTPIRLIVWERIPISRSSDIKVELQDSGGASFDPEKGQLRWEFTLEPGQTWERSFRFVVKYPKQKPIIGL